MWSEELAAILRDKIGSGNLSPGGFSDVLGKLLKMGDVYAKEQTQLLATGAVPSKGEDRLRIVSATAQLLSHYPAEWRSMWPVFQANELFGIEVLQLIGSDMSMSALPPRSLRTK